MRSRHLHELDPDLWTVPRPHSFLGCVVVAHGEVPESGKALLRDGYAWLLRAGG